MNKHTETKQTDDKNTNIETIETIELDTVVGGCARCGCGQPDAPGAQQVATNWLRR